MGKTREYLNSEEIVKAAVAYIKEQSYSHALLIDGEWGTGKTHILTGALKEKIEKTPTRKSGKYYHKAVYLSLYGASSVDDLSKQILTKILTDKIPGGKRVKKVVGVAKEIGGAALKIGSSLLDNKLLTALSDKRIGLDGIWASLVELDDYVFIFDDLERCTMPIHEAMGFISSLIESNNAKVIIAANQNEISHIEAYKNLEQKYWICTSSQIDFESIDEEWHAAEKARMDPFMLGFLDEKKNETNEPMKLDMLSHRVHEVFGKDPLYEKIREKIVGKVLFYRPNLRTVLPELLKETEFSLLTNEKVLEICAEIMEQNRHYNLRTFLATMQLLKQVSPIISSISIKPQYLDLPVKQFSETYKPALAECVLKYMITIAIRRASNINMPSWHGRNRTHLANHYPTPLPDIATDFLFVDEYFYLGLFNASIVKKDLVSLLLDWDLSLFRKDDPIFSKLSGYLRLEESEIETEIMRFKGYFEQDNCEYYDAQEYDSILAVLLSLQHYGFDTPVEICFQTMKEKVKEKGYIIDLDFGHHIIPTEAMKEKHKTYLQELEQFSPSKEMDINTYFTAKQGWASKMREDIKSKGMYGALIDMMDFEKCMDCLKQSTNDDIFMFTSVITHGIGHGGDVAKTQENLSHFNTLLKDLIEGLTIPSIKNQLFSNMKTEVEKYLNTDYKEGRFLRDSIEMQSRGPR